MTRYTPPAMVCARCKEPVRSGPDGWQHVRKLRMGEWHRAEPVAKDRPLLAEKDECA